MKNAGFIFWKSIFVDFMIFKIYTFNYKMKLKRFLKDDLHNVEE